PAAPSATSSIDSASATSSIFSTSISTGVVRPTTGRRSMSPTRRFASASDYFSSTCVRNRTSTPHRWPSRSTLRRNNDPRQGRENHRRERRRDMPHQAIPRPAHVPGDVVRRRDIRAEVKNELNRQREKHERLAPNQFTSHKQRAEKETDP